MSEQCQDCFYYENMVIDLRTELKEANAKLGKAEALALSAEFAIEYLDKYGSVFTPWENDLSKSLKGYREETK